MDVIDRIQELMLSSGIENAKAADAAQKIKSEFGGDAIYIPKKCSVDRSAIMNDIRSGISKNEFCSRYRMSKVTYYRMLHKLRRAKNEF